MSLENYVTGLMKNPSPDLKGRLMLSLLDKLEKLYLSQVVKRREAEEKSAEDCGIPVISVGNVSSTRLLPPMKSCWSRMIPMPKPIGVL